MQAGMLKQNFHAALKTDEAQGSRNKELLLEKRTARCFIITISVYTKLVTPDFGG